MSALAELRSAIQTLVDGGKTPPYNMTISKRYADKLLSADVVEVVRCKDCKLWGIASKHEIKEPYKRCGLLDGKIPCEIATPPTMYCGWGERREDEKE